MFPNERTGDVDVHRRVVGLAAAACVRQQSPHLVLQAVPHAVIVRLVRGHQAGTMRIVSPSRLISRCSGELRFDFLFHRDNDFSFGVSFCNIPERFRHLT